MATEPDGGLPGESLEELALGRGQLGGKGRIGLQERLGVTEVLKALRTTPGRVRPGPELLVEQVDPPNHPETDAASLDRLRSRDRSGERGIVGELDRGAVGPSPILGMDELAVAREARRLQSITGNRVAPDDRQVDVERRPGLGQVDLGGDTTDDRVGDAGLIQDAADGQERRLLGAFHLPSQEVPLPVEHQARVEPAHHRMDDHTVDRVAK